MTDIKEKGVLSMKGKRNNKEQQESNKEKLAIMTEHENLKQKIMQETEDAKQSFWSKFNEIRIKQDELKDHEAKQRDNIELMIRAVTAETQRSVADISRSIIGHGATNELAEKFINPIEMLRSKAGEALEDDDKSQIVAKVEGTHHQNKVINTLPKVRSTLKSKHHGEQDKPEKHVTFKKTIYFENRQVKKKPYVMNKCKTKVEHDVPGESRTSKNNLKKKTTPHPKTIIKAKTVVKTKKLN